MRGYVFMMVTSDKYQLPLAVADTPRELSRLVGVSAKLITEEACRKRKARFVKVYIGELENELS